MMYTSDKQPYCRVCGKAIAKYTTHIWVNHAPSSLPKPPENTLYLRPDEYPRSKAACQKLTNLRVISVSYRDVYDSGFNIVGKEINAFGTWDGESYRDPYFCNGTCRDKFAYMAATAYPKLRTQAAADAEKARVGEKAA